jgi:hypothetical protein
MHKVDNTVNTTYIGKYNMSFQDLKRNRSSSIDALTKAAEAVGGGQQQQTKSYVDDRFWKPTVDKAGNGYAVIRFLPAPAGEELPWVRYWDHGFQGPGGLWYIENSLTSVGQPDPVSEMNSVLWNTGREEDKQIARDRKRRLHYVSNIQVISDPGNPANEGKVFLYKFGKKIFDKIMDVMQPQFADEQPVNPFDFWDGANFKLKIQQVGGYRNYDKSEFAESSVMTEDDAVLEATYNKLYSLQDFVDPKNYKSYEELSARLAKVLGEQTVRTTAESISLDESAPAPSFHSDVGVATAAVSGTDDSTDDSEDTLSYFQKLASQG